MFYSFICDILTMCMDMSDQIIVARHLSDDQKTSKIVYFPETFLLYKNCVIYICGCVTNIHIWR